MESKDILLEIDREIARLTQARDLLSNEGSGVRSAKTTGAKRVKRVLSPEARKRIADAQRKRWAAQKKAAK